jgi:hypothetical protein
MSASIYSPSSSTIHQMASLFLGATDFQASGTATLTRTAKGNWNWAVGNSETVYLAAALKTILRDYISSVVNYSYTGTKQAPLSLKTVTAYYSIGTADATTLTVGITDTAYPASGTATAPTSITDLLAATALTKTHATDMYAVQVTPTNTALLPNASDELIAEIEVVTPGTGTFVFYGLLLQLEYNV